MVLYIKYFKQRQSVPRLIHRPDPNAVFKLVRNAFLSRRDNFQKQFRIPHAYEVSKSDLVQAYPEHWNLEDNAVGSTPTYTDVKLLVAFEQLATGCAALNLSAFVGMCVSSIITALHQLCDGLVEHYAAEFRNTDRKDSRAW